MCDGMNVSTDRKGNYANSSNPSREKPKRGLPRASPGLNVSIDAGIDKNFMRRNTTVLSEITL